MNIIIIMIKKKIIISDQDSINIIYFNQICKICIILVIAYILVRYMSATELRYLVTIISSRNNISSHCGNYNNQKKKKKLRIE